MSIELLFENRKLIGKNILNIIKDNGYTKFSFSRFTYIWQPTLDKLIKEEVDSLATFIDLELDAELVKPFYVVNLSG